MAYLVKGNLKYNGNRYAEGDVADIDAENAAILLADGVIELIDKTPEPVTAADEAPQAPEAPAADPLVVTPVVSEPVVAQEAPINQATAATQPTPEQIAETLASVDISAQQNSGLTLG